MTSIRRVSERESDLPACTAMKGMLHHVGIVTTPTIIILQYCDPAHNFSCLQK